MQINYKKVFNKINFFKKTNFCLLKKLKIDLNQLFYTIFKIY